MAIDFDLRADASAEWIASPPASEAPEAGEGIEWEALPAPDAVESAVAEPEWAGSAVPEPEWVAMDYPWRFTAWRRPGTPRPVASPIVGEVDRPHSTVEDAQMLPAMPSMRIDGVVMPGERLDLYGLSVGRGTRSVEITYRVPEPGAWGEHGERDSARLWLMDAEGNVLGTWDLEASDRGLEVRLFSFVPPEPTTFYVGIGAVSATGGAAEPLPYALEVRLGAGRGPGRFPAPGLSQSPAPPVGDWGPIDGLPAVDRSGIIGPGMAGPLGPGPGSGVVPVDASGEGGTGLGFLGPGGPGPAGIGGAAFARPLPTQAAAAVGGLLPAGPDVRGDSGMADRVPRVDEFADPLLLAAEPTRPPGESEVGPNEPSGTGEVPAGASPTGLVASSGGAVARAGARGLPALVAGLRIALGRSASPPAVGPASGAPEDLALIAVAPPPEPDAGGAGVEGGAFLVQGPPRGEDGLDPTRPRVLRTALIGAAALAVGLILPDLAADGPSLRGRRAGPLRPWRLPRPHTD